MPPKATAIQRLDSGSHEKYQVKAGVPFTVEFEVPPPLGRGPHGFTGGTFDAPLDAGVQLQIDGGPISPPLGANGARVRSTSLKTGMHTMTATLQVNVEKGYKAGDSLLLGFVVWVT